MLEQLDQKLFLFLNSINSPFYDQVMYTLTGKLIWIPLYLSIIVFLAFKYKRKFLILLIFIIVAAILADQTSVIIKNLTQRLRPCHEPELKGLVHMIKGECGGMYSFVSSHASNSFDVALISLLLIKRRWYSISIIIWALVVGYTRIYLGVHYPGDVICGSLLGAVIGWSVISLYELADNKILKKRPYFNEPQTPGVGG
jgi:undecaprenyl-diphosphatase